MQNERHVYLQFEIHCASFYTIRNTLCIFFNLRFCVTYIALLISRSTYFKLFVKEYNIKRLQNESNLKRLRITTFNVYRFNRTLNFT